MTIVKRNIVYVVISVIAIITGITISAIGKNILNTGKAQAEAKKTDSNLSEKNEKSAVVESGDKNTSQPVTETLAEDSTDVDDDSAAAATEENRKYPLHKNISATYFWAGEEAGKENKNISNLPSAWDEDWAKHFGGVDDPDKRAGFFPAKFTPKENPFYVALPYNDFDENGNHKKNATALATWASGKKWGAEESMCKNQWVKIIKNGKAAYAQWEDVGPFGEDDSAYVFGNSVPKSKTNKNAGIDVSPAVHDFLSMGDIDKVDWQFVDASQVPDGPWKKVTTSSQVFWN